MFIPAQSLRTFGPDCNLNRGGEKDVPASVPPKILEVGEIVQLFEFFGQWPKERQNEDIEIIVHLEVSDQAQGRR